MRKIRIACTLESITSDGQARRGWARKAEFAGANEHFLDRLQRSMA